MVASNRERKNICNHQAGRGAGAHGILAPRTQEPPGGGGGRSSWIGRRIERTPDKPSASHAGNGSLGLILTVRFSLEQFSAVLGVRDAAGKPHVLIGGQAVYFWAARYAKTEPALEQARPFTSADLDFHGGREDVLHLARQLGLPHQFPPPVALTALAGVIPIKIGEANTNIEFVRQIAGLKSADIPALAIERDFHGNQIRVLDPISLLCGKTNLAMKVDQKQRRDADHLRILVICVRAFLRETLLGVTAGELPARGWLGAVERVLKLAESTIGKQAARKLGVDWPEALPEKEILASEHPLIAQFRQKRLPQWREKQTPCAR